MLPLPHIALSFPTGSLLFISGAEIGFILFFVLVLFGAKKVPEIARGLGKGIRQVRQATDEIKSEITGSADVDDLGKDVKKEIESAKKEMEEVTGSVRRNI